MSTAVVEAHDLGKLFRIYANPWDRFRGILSGWEKRPPHEVWAVKNIDLWVPSGRCLGIIGMNGAGKSTLLKLLTGVIRPTEGSLALRGGALALLELGTGFNAEISGRENLFFIGTLLGYSHAAIAAKVEAIRQFADIGEYFDQPVKTYSSGMFVRLAFSFYLHLEPGLLIVDEALSVGDFFFQQKCASAMRGKKADGISIVFVSHDTAAVQELADEVVLLERGRIVARGDTNAVVTRYFSSAPNAAKPSENPDTGTNAFAPSPLDAALKQRIDAICATDTLSSATSTGKTGAILLGVRMSDENGRPTNSYPSGKNIHIEAVIEARHAIPHANFGLQISDDQDRCVWSAATSNQGVWFGNLENRDLVVVCAELTLNLPPGTYHLNFGTGEVDPYDPSFAVWNDTRIKAAAIEVLSTEQFSDRRGIAFIPLEISAL